MLLGSRQQFDMSVCRQFLAEQQYPMRYQAVDFRL